MQARVSVCVWSSAAILSLPSTVAAQDRPARELVDLVVRDGPQAAAIRAAVEVVRRDQSARLAPSNPVAEYSREGAGFTEFLQVE
jgi:hypothetical protein